MFDPEMMEAYYQETRKQPDEEIKEEVVALFETFDHFDVETGDFIVVHRDGRYVTQKEDEYHQHIEGSSYERFYHRLGRFKTNKSFPRTRHAFWWLLHNCVAHIAIGLVPVKASFALHDWTSKKLNLGN